MRAALYYSENDSHAYPDLARLAIFRQVVIFLSRFNKNIFFCFSLIATCQQEIPNQSGAVFYFSDAGYVTVTQNIFIS